METEATEAKEKEDQLQRIIEEKSDLDLEVKKLENTAKVMDTKIIKLVDENTTLDNQTKELQKLISSKEDSYERSLKHEREATRKKNEELQMNLDTLKEKVDNYEKEKSKEEDKKKIIIKIITEKRDKLIQEAIEGYIFEPESIAEMRDAEILYWAKDDFTWIKKRRKKLNDVKLEICQVVPETDIDELDKIIEQLNETIRVVRREQEKRGGTMKDKNLRQF